MVTMPDASTTSYDVLPYADRTFVAAEVGAGIGTNATGDARPGRPGRLAPLTPAYNTFNGLPRVDHRGAGRQRPAPLNPPAPQTTTPREKISRFRLPDRPRAQLGACGDDRGSKPEEARIFPGFRALIARGIRMELRKGRGATL
jgi:hypothetical protein